jgi:hypothetical protein
VTQAAPPATTPPATASPQVSSQAATPPATAPPLASPQATPPSSASPAATAPAAPSPAQPPSDFNRLPEASPPPTTTGSAPAARSSGDPFQAVASQSAPRQTPTAPAAAHDYAGWKQYAPQQAGFEVKFPSDPATKSTPSGDEVIQIAGVQRSGIDGLGYVCQWIVQKQPFPNEAFKTGYLQGQREAAVRAFQGTLIEEKEINLNGARGSEFLVSISPDNFLRSRVYLSDRCVISLQVWGKDETAVRSHDADAFLSSLQLNAPLNSPLRPR